MIKLAVTEENLKKLLFAIITLQLIFLIFYVARQSFDLPYDLRKVVNIFRFHKVASVSGWFTSVQLFLSGLLLLGYRQWQDSERISNRKILFYLGVMLIFMSILEGSKLFEYVVESIMGRAQMFGLSGPAEWLATTLHVVTLMAILWAGSTMFQSVLSIRNRGARIVIRSILFLIAGRIAAELIGVAFYPDEEVELMLTLDGIFEETVEMFGTTMVLYGISLCAIKRL